MKHLVDTINESKIRYELPDDFEDKSKSILNDLIKYLPDYPGITSNYGGFGAYGKFGYNPYDLLRYKVESSNFIGQKDVLAMGFDTETNSQINVDDLKRSFNAIFESHLNEGIFDNNINKKMPEYEWTMKLYNGLCEYFKTNKLQNIHFKKQPNDMSANIYKELAKCPTIEVGDYIISLYGILVDQLRENYKWQSIGIQVYIYLKKDQNKIDELKAAEAARISTDCIGRKLEVGDTVAFSIRGIADGYDPLPVGVITSVGKSQVQIEYNNKSKPVYGYRCCLISRKDGKKIE